MYLIFLHAVFSSDHPSEDGSGFKFKYVCVPIFLMERDCSYLHKQFTQTIFMKNENVSSLRVT